MKKEIKIDGATYRLVEEELTLEDCIEEEQQ